MNELLDFCTLFLMDGLDCILILGKQTTYFRMTISRYAKKMCTNGNSNVIRYALKVRTRYYEINFIGCRS